MTAAMRVDLYTRPHKAMRLALYQAAMNVGLLDADKPVSTIRETLAGVRAAVQQLLEHGRHEDAFIHPLYKERISSSALDLLEKDHVLHEQKLLLLRTSADELERSVSDAGLARLYKGLNDFIVTYLQHLDLEESQLPLLWAAYSDEELMHLFRCFQASEGDQDALTQVAGFWAGLPETEAHRLRAGMRQNASETTFATIKQRLNFSI